MTRQYLVGGSSDGPVNGQTIFTSDFLGSCMINFMIINNVPENQIGGTPDFTHSYVEKCIKRANQFLTGDRVIIDFTPCNNCS